ncbi:MAG: FAD binding domain-containing protein [Pseudomonadota bacterium]
MSDFRRPTSIGEAVDLLSQGPIVIAAGCTDLFPATSASVLAGPVMDITGIAELGRVTQGPKGVRIGAAATWTKLVQTPLPPAFDMLKQAAQEVGSVQIQNAGTVVGNICNASPAADGVPALLAVETRVELTSTRGVRQVPLDQFITGVRQTARRPDELVTAVWIPAAATGGTSRFLKLGARAHLVISIVMVAVRLRIDAGHIAQAALAVGSCSAVATRLPELEQALHGLPVRDVAATVTEARVAPMLSPIDDIRADADYRISAATELLGRAVDHLVRPQRRAA